MESSWALRAALLVALVMVIHFQVDAVSGSPVLDDYAESKFEGGRFQTEVNLI